MAALQGFSRVKMFPVTKNDATGYKVGEGFDVPEAQEMTRDMDTSETKINADDRIYLNMKSWNGINSTITFVEMSLEMIAKLGFGTYDEDTGTLKADPQGQNKEYAMTFQCLMTDGSYRRYKMFSFKINEIKETGIKTKGDGSDINKYQMVGTFTGRVVDKSPYEVNDGTDTAWLDTIEPVNA